MPEVFFKLNADQKQAVDAILKVVEAQKKSEGGFKRMNGEADKFSETMDKIKEAGVNAGKSLVENMAPGLTKLTTIGGAAEAAVAAVDRAIAKGTERAKAMADQVERLRSELAKSGQVSMMPELESKIKDLSQRQTIVSRDELSRQAGGLSAKFGTDLSTDQIVKSLQYGVRAGKSGLDVGVASETFGQLTKLFPQEDVGSAAGQLLGKGFNPLDDGEMLEAKRISASGGSLKDALPTLLAMRESGEKAKIAETLREEASSEISPEALKPKKQIREESQKRIEELERQRTDINTRKADLEREEVGMENSGNTKSSAAKRRMRQIGLEKKNLGLQTTDIGLEMETLRRDEVETLTEDQRRKARLAALPMDQRQEAIIRNPEIYGSVKNESKFRNYGDSILQYQKEGATDIVSKGYSDTQDLEREDPRFRAVQELNTLKVQKENFEAGKRDSVPGLTLETDAQMLEARIRKTSGDTAAKAVGYAYRGALNSDIQKAVKYATSPATAAFQDLISPVPKDDTPQKVELVSDQSKLKRVVPSRNGGD